MARPRNTAPRRRQRRAVLASGRGRACGDLLHVYCATPAASRAVFVWAASPAPSGIALRR
eukprot:11660029-Alexandrium_andersonii.AAC.1